MTNQATQTTPDTGEQRNPLLGSEPFGNFTGPLAGLNIQTKVFDGRASGIRCVDALGSQIIVHAGPADEFAKIADLAGLHDRTVCYVLVADRPLEKFYIGKGSVNSRLPYQTSKCRAGKTFVARQIYILHARDGRIDEIAAPFIEAHLIKTGFAMGAPLTNRMAGLLLDTGDDHLVDFERMGEEALLFLTSAGFSGLEDSGTRSSDYDETGSSLIDGYRIIPADAFTPPEGAQLLRLTRSNFICEGYVLDNGHLIVRPGSHFQLRDNTGNLRDANVRRRAAILGRAKLEVDPQWPDRKRTTQWIEFVSPNVAMRVHIGLHSTNTSWGLVKQTTVGIDDLVPEVSDAPAL
jgi:hypothetical protein